MHEKKPRMAPAVFARKAAHYFRTCDLGVAGVSCDACGHDFGADDCYACAKRKPRPYTLSGLCLALGVTKREFSQMKRDEAYTEAVEMAMLRIEAYIEENSIAGSINGTLALAILRENFDWGEKQEQDAISVVLSEEAKRLAK